MMDEKNANAISNDVSDNLQEIDGIGPKYADALHEGGISQFAQLAQFESAEHLQEELSERAGRDLPLWKIKKEDWIGQAREKAAASKTGQPKSGLSEIKWDEYAAFIVTFDHGMDEKNQIVWRTRVYRTENGEEELFSGVEPEPWISWIFEEAELPFVLESTPSVSEVSDEPMVTEAEEVESIPSYEAEKEETEIKVAKVEISEIAHEPDQPEARYLAEVRFELSGVETKEMVQNRDPFRVELHTIDLEVGESKLVISEDSELQPQVFAYTSKLEFIAPRDTPSRLHYAALLFPPFNRTASWQFAEFTS